MRLLMVVPTYNERDNILRLIDELLAQPVDCAVVVVDDASPDGTGNLVRERAAREPRVHLISRAGKLGLGTAYVAGLRYGLEQGFDVVGTMDADFSHDPKYLPALAAAVAQPDTDIAIGSRYVPDGGTVNWGVHRQLLSGGANAFARCLLGFTTRDNTAGFRLYRAAFLRTVDIGAIRSNGYSFLLEFLYRCNQAGARVREVPIIFVDRREGLSKISKQEIIRALLTVVRLRLRG